MHIAFISILRNLLTNYIKKTILNVFCFGFSAIACALAWTLDSICNSKLACDFFTLFYLHCPISSSRRFMIQY